MCLRGCQHSQLTPPVPPPVPCGRYMTDAGPLDQIQDEDSDSDDLLPPTLGGGAAGESGLPGTGGWPWVPRQHALVLHDVGGRLSQDRECGEC